MSSEAVDLVVVLDAPELGRARPVGVLSHWPDSRAIAFAYARSWLQSDDSFALDPRLPLIEGRRYLPGSEPPPILRDTAPDLWGTLLLERRAGRRLNPWELLTGVSDETRMGALRLQRGVDGPYVDDREAGIPPVARLRAVQAAARAFEEDPEQPLADSDIAILITPGSSLGGARPKANFRDEDGTLWIAKFPSRTDRQDSAAWEFVYADLARSAGIEVPDHLLLDLGGRGRIFATRRFDRTPDGRRLYASAMTLTERDDGDPASYLEIAEAVRLYGAPGDVRGDLEQLFRRLVFNVLAGNRDDHLRNHGFLRSPAGWRLAPAFDMNPAREQREHSIGIDGSTLAPDILAAVATHQAYGISDSQAVEIVRAVAAAVSRWPEEASRAGISEREQQAVGVAFSALPSAGDLVGVA